MQVLARGLTRQQADERRDHLIDIGCAIRTVRWPSRRLGVLRWCLIDLHPSALCIDARANCSSGLQETTAASFTDVATTMAKDCGSDSEAYQACAWARRIAQTIASSVAIGSSGRRQSRTSRTPGPDGRCSAVRLRPSGLPVRS